MATEATFPWVEEWLATRTDEVAVLRSFVAEMERELAANAAKGDRPGWLQMTPRDAIAEVLYHAGKLAVAVRQIQREPDLRMEMTIDDVREYAADVANCALMVADICGALPEPDTVAMADKQPCSEATMARELRATADEANREDRAMTNAWDRLDALLDQYDASFEVNTSTGAMWAAELRLTLSDPDGAPSRSMTFYGVAHDHPEDAATAVLDDAERWVAENPETPPMPPPEWMRDG